MPLVSQVWSDALLKNFYDELMKDVMAQRTITVELKVEMTPENNKIMDQATRAAAKHLLSTAALLQDGKRPPLISISSDDHFDGHNVIELTEDMLAEGPEDGAKVSEGEGAHSDNAQYARSAGYTVSDRGNGWFYNDPDGSWSPGGYANEAAAWEAAWAAHAQENKR